MTSDQPSAIPSAAEIDLGAAPQLPFLGLETLWVQVTGTLCNLTCTHCFIACSPHNDTLRFMSRGEIRRYADEAIDLGVKEIYFTGGEPFLHPDILDILADSLAVAPTAVLTNGVLITERTAARLGEMAAASDYSLEVRVSLDAPDEDANDAIRGAGVFRKALRGLRRLQDHGLMPILTACELVVEEDEPAGNGERSAAAGTAAAEQLPSGVPAELIPPKPGDAGFYGRFFRLLQEHGIERPRIKILPVFNMGMLEGRRPDRVLTEQMLENSDTANLQCSSARLVAHDGVYACPILAGEEAARLSDRSLREAQGPCSLYHASCTTCLVTGMTCRNY